VAKHLDAGRMSGLSERPQEAVAPTSDWVLCTSVVGIRCCGTCADGYQFLAPSSDRLDPLF
jgi:hypothetical protein